MIGAVAKAGRDFHGLASYLKNGKKNSIDPKRVDWFATLNLGVGDPIQAARIMRITARKAPKCQLRVAHFCVSWAVDEAPSREKMRAVAYDLLEELGLSEHQAVLVAHKDTDHRHVHIMVNRVHPVSLKAWDRWKDKKRVEIAVAELADRYGFRVVAGRHNRRGKLVDKAKRPGQGEIQAALRKNLAQPLPSLNKDQVAAVRPHLVKLFTDAASWQELAKALLNEGLGICPKGEGYIILGNGWTMKLSDLRRDIRMRHLEERFGQSFDEGYVAWIVSEQARRAAAAASTSDEDDGADAQKPAAQPPEVGSGQSRKGSEARAEPAESKRASDVARHDASGVPLHTSAPGGDAQARPNFGSGAADARPGKTGAAASQEPQTPEGGAPERPPRVALTDGLSLEALLLSYGLRVISRQPSTSVKPGAAKSPAPRPDFSEDDRRKAYEKAARALASVQEDLPDAERYGDVYEIRLLKEKEQALEQMLAALNSSRWREELERIRLQRLAGLPDHEGRRDRAPPARSPGGGRGGGRGR